MNINDISAGNFANELIFVEKNGLGNVLKSFSKNKIFTQREIQSLELTGENVLNGLFEHFVRRFY